MRLTRVYVHAPLAVGATLDLPEAATRHLLHALRLGTGDHCVLFNGDGHDYTARIEIADKRRLAVRIAECQSRNTESALHITLLQALARGEKMDWILQKATELGVIAVRPMVSERSEVRLDAERSARRETHWRGVLAAACEQCGRARLPALHAPTRLPSALAELPTGSRVLYLDPDAEATLSSIAAVPQQPLAIVIGPEGGWSARDLGELAAVGAHGLRLGPRVLRTETAGLAAIAALQALAGDWR